VLVTTLDFTAWRVAALKYFFKQRLGFHWQRRVALALGFKGHKDVFRYTTKQAGRFSTLVKLEEVALRLGWNPAGPVSLMRPPPTPTVLPVSESESREQGV
jgi:hypothetical protein